jgi:predicted enzyme related to lactoylglutathione lyase
MAEVSSHVPGTFCWVELVANDALMAGRFYEIVFGWDKREIPMGPDSVYTIWQSGGRDVAAMYGRGPAEREGPSHWRSYLAVDSADDMARKALELDADVLAEPFDVFDIGRMAMLRDPSGAMIALWEPKTHVGVGRTGEPGALCWNELLTRDVEGAAAFYSGLFGWDVRTMDFGGSSYTVFEGPEGPLAGMIAMPDPADAAPNWLPYFGVPDTDDRARAAKIAGGQIYVAPADAPGVGRFAVLGDPQGAVVAIIREEGWS